MTAECVPNPGDGPDDLDAALREFAEFESNRLLLQNLHLLHEAVQDADDDTDDTFDSLGELSNAVQKNHRSILGYDPLVMDPFFDEMRWVPEPGTQTAFLADHIMVRHPRLIGEEYGVLPGSMLTPNDVFVEVILRNGDKQRYVLNGRGISAYADAESLGFTIDEIIDPLRGADELPNAFNVAIPHPFAQDLTASELNHMLFGESKLQLPA